MVLIKPYWAAVSLDKTVTTTIDKPWGQIKRRFVIILQQKIGFQEFPYLKTKRTIKTTN